MRRPGNLENPEKGWDEEIGLGFQGMNFQRLF
jgi:hypothetical protein